MSSAEGRRFRSGLLDILVERIARTIGSSAVFVVGEAPAAGLSFIAEFPPGAASRSVGAEMHKHLAEGCYEGAWMEEQIVAVPLSPGDAVMGWAAAIGPALDQDKEAEGLVTLLAKSASTLLGTQAEGDAAHHGRPRWEDAARDGYWEWDLDTGAMRYSRQSLSLLEHNGPDRPSRPEVWLDRVHPDDRAALIAALLTAMAESGGPVDCEHRVVRRDGSVSWLVARMLLERDDAGHPVRLVGWLCDMSRTQHVESELRKAQSLADLGRLAAGNVHDFNNFLTIIRGHTELALGSVDLDSSARESLELIKHAAAGATSLTRQVLALRRRHTLAQSVVDLNAVVTAAERTLRSLAGTANQLVTSLEPTVGGVRADAAQVERMLINLVVNARDAMPRGGVVTIDTGNASHATLGADARPLLLAPGDYVTLTVRDTGAGMDEETRSHIFEPFFTTKPDGRGTGLGLWIVRDVMERSGGAIDVRSTPGHGTAFVMYFPRVSLTTGA